MTGPALATGTVGLRASYFYLSYAHSPGLARTPEVSHDYLVRKFFDNLVAAVKRKTPERSSMLPGFFDQEIPVDSDWKASLARALSAAEAFVPLYSEGYFARSWPGREWACYQQRLIDARVSDPMSRVLPVLWVPLPPGREAPLLDRALALGGVDPVYAENGLRAMLQLTPYRGQYELIVDQLAANIVELGETSPLMPSAVPDIDDVQSPFNPGDATALLAIAVAAPAGSTWRPFREQELSLADYAATIGEQLDFAVLVADAKRSASPFERNPGLLLIDPSIVADPQELQTLRSMAGALPPWVMPVIVIGSAPISNRVTEDVRTVRAILESSAFARTEPVRRALSGVGSLEDFVALMPFLIVEAERQYLRRGPIVRTTARPGSRPRLAGGEAFGESGPQVMRPKEEPDE
jgi:hypothetical protein